MALSKKIRFEVFKRDGFQCCYCGKCPPQVVLEVDHIDPKSKGGADTIDNLLTACFDCNRGKSNISLDKVPKKISENLELIQEKEAQLIEYRKFIAKIQKRINKDVEKISMIFSEAYPGRGLSDKFKNVSIKKVY